MRSYLDHVQPDDALFAFFFQRICEDRGQDATSVDPAQVLEDLRDAKWLSVLGPKSQQSRWFSFQAAQQFWQPYVSERLAGLCYLGVIQGWFTTVERAGMVIRPLRSAASKDNEQKESMQAEGEKDARMRDRCANGLHLASCILGCVDIQYDCNIALHMGGAIWRSHQYWAHHLRSADDSVMLAAQLASGNQHAQILEQLVLALSDLAGLKHCGLQVDFSGPS